jgi:SAM-dependent methyltransferase
MDNIGSSGRKRDGHPVDFGRTAHDYVNHRVGFPDSLFERLRHKGIGTPKHVVLDLGTGTGVMARGFARGGCHVTGLDISPLLIAESKKLDAQAQVKIDYILGPAESIPLPSASVDIVSAGQCWHWFDRRAVLGEVLRLLRPGGVLMIAAFDWIPFGRNIVEQTEELIEKHNPAQPKPHIRLAMGAGLYPPFVRDLSEGGLSDIETWSYDHSVRYSHAGWRGRIRASQGVGATLPAPKVAAFDEELTQLLRTHFPSDPIDIPHRVWVAHGRKP